MTPPRNRPIVHILTNVLSINADQRGARLAYAAITFPGVIGAKKPCNAPLRHCAADRRRAAHDKNSTARRRCRHRCSSRASMRSLASCATESAMLGSRGCLSHQRDTRVLRRLALTPCLGPQDVSKLGRIAPRHSRRSKARAEASAICFIRGI